MASRQTPTPEEVLQRVFLRALAAVVAMAFANLVIVMVVGLGSCPDNGGPGDRVGITLCRPSDHGLPAVALTYTSQFLAVVIVIVSAYVALKRRATGPLGWGLFLGTIWLVAFLIAGFTLR